MNTIINYKSMFMVTGIALVVSLIVYFSLCAFKNPKELKVVFLATKPQYVSTLAEWTYNKWKNYDPTLTLEKTTEHYKNRLNVDKVPFALLLLDEEMPIGMVYLDEHKPIEEFLDKSPWIGDFYVLPKYDRQGIKFRRYLMRDLDGVSKNLGIQKLYVYTSDPSRVDWYTELGWEIVKVGMHHDHLVTIMEYSVKK